MQELVLYALCLRTETDMHDKDITGESARSQ